MEQATKTRLRVKRNKSLTTSQVSSKFTVAVHLIVQRIEADSQYYQVLATKLSRQSAEAFKKTLQLENIDIIRVVADKVF